MTGELALRRVAVSWRPGSARTEPGLTVELEELRASIERMEAPLNS